jgi:hypothetical protein
MVSSPAGELVVADARQCRQASRQARVVSQKTSIGRVAKSMPATVAHRAAAGQGRKSRSSVCGDRR